MEFLRDRALIAASTEIETPTLLPSSWDWANASRARRGWSFRRWLLAPQQIGSPQESNRTGSKRPESTRAIPWFHLIGQYMFSQW